MPFRQEHFSHRMAGKINNSLLTLRRKKIIILIVFFLQTNKTWDLVKKKIGNIYVGI